MNQATVTRLVAKLVSPIARRVRVMVTRAVLETINDDTDLQSVKLQALDDMVRDDIEHFQPGGLSHNPPADSEGLLLAVGGDSSHGVLLAAAARKKRPKGLQPGETKVYAVDGGYLLLKSDGSAQLVPQGSGIINVGATDPAEFAAKAGPTNSRFEALETAHNALVTAFNAFVALYNAHSQTSTTKFVVDAVNGSPVTVNAPATPAVAASTLTPGSSVAASKVKVE